MQFNFTEHDYPDAYKHGGRLEIVAENPQEVEHLVNHFKLFPDMSTVESLEARISALKAGTYRHTIGTDKRPVYGVDGWLDAAFSAPYTEWMQRDLGYNGPLPDLELPRKWDGLLYTNYQRRVYILDGFISFGAFTQSMPWGGKTAQEYAVTKITDLIGEEFGTRYHESEFVSAGYSGTLKRNPNYLKRHPATPAASNAILKRALFDWWLENHANEAQKTIVAGNQEIVDSTNEYMEAFNFKRYDSQIYYGHELGKDSKTQDYKSMTFAEFAALT